MKPRISTTNWCTNAIAAARTLGHITSWWNLPHPIPYPTHEVQGIPCPELHCVLTPGARQYSSDDHNLAHFCRQRDYRGSGIVAFLDGSYSTNLSGYAAILIKAEDFYLSPSGKLEALHCPASHVVLKGKGPVSGANYTAEVLAILHTLRATPINIPLFIWSDALSMMQALQKPLVSEFQRLRLGSRTLVLPARAFL